MATMDMYQIAPNPNRTIACQDLLIQDDCVHSGWLRRQSLRNKFKMFVWPQVYVAIAGGCLYCYSSEVSRRPVTTFSLYGYDKVFRAGEVSAKEATWSFKLVHVNPSYRSYLFSASSHKEMTQWMSHFKTEMLRANGKLPRTHRPLPRTPADGAYSDAATYQDSESAASADSISSQDLQDIESSIYEDCSQFVLPSNYSNKKEEDDSGDEMDRLVVTRPDLQKDRPPVAPPVPTRPGAKMQQGQQAAAQAAITKELKRLNVSGHSTTSDVEPVRAKKDARPGIDRTSKPLVRGEPDGSATKKKEVDANEFWTSIFFFGGKEKAHEIIGQIADDGVFLVRVNEDKSMVLHIYAKGQSRKFIIFKYDNQYALDKDAARFDRVEELVHHYYFHPVPKVDICLTECYIFHDDYHKLQW